MAIGILHLYECDFCRTPKQKLKFKVSTESLLEKLQQSLLDTFFIHSLFKDHRKEVKIKEAMQMNHIVSVVTDQIHEMQSLPSAYDSDMSGPLKWKEITQVEDVEQNEDNLDEENDDEAFAQPNPLHTSLDCLSLNESKTIRSLDYI